MRAFLIVLLLALGVGPSATRADEADIVRAEVYSEGAGRWRFVVTVRHADSGWDHYADRWEVLTPDGHLLATRKLLHPHENEQPFTRSLGGVAIAPEVSQVRLRAHDSRDGYGGREVALDLPR
jgi:hypothetical protein